MSEEDMRVDLSALSAPFRNDEIEWRVGRTYNDKGLALAYMDARAAMKRLDDVCGVNGWQNRHPYANGKTCCEIGIWCGENHGWVWKANGAGDTQFEGDKGAFSDAFKRACVQWGIGRYLYDMPNIYVGIEKKGNSFAIQQGEYKRLHQAHDQLIANLGLSPSTHTGVRAIDDWVKQRVDGIASYAALKEASIPELDKKYDLLKKHAVQSRVTAQQLFMISDQYSNAKLQIANRSE